MNKTFKKEIFKIIVVAAFGLTLPIVKIYSQMPTPPPPPPEDNTWWYALLFILFIGLGGALYWMVTNRKALKKESDSLNTSSKKNSEDIKDLDAIDSFKELEWLRSNRETIDRKRKKKQKFPENLPHPTGILNGIANRQNEEETVKLIPLPIFGIQRVNAARSYKNLSVSSDEALLSAIEQTYDEYEEDEEVRDLAVRILTAFKTKNSVEALSQVALYDLSSTLRSKAVATLADFNHESVFEPILLSCADPTREVRAAAARGISRLSFDRSDAWSRIAETGEQGRMKQAARAAIEGGFVERIFDRLVHRDEKMVLEAVSLLNLLIKADETDPLFKKLDDDSYSDMQSAILHVIKISKDEKVLSKLYALVETRQLPDDLRNEVDETIMSLQQPVTA